MTYCVYRIWQNKSNFNVEFCIFPSTTFQWCTFQFLNKFPIIRKASRSAILQTGASAVSTTWKSLTNATFYCMLYSSAKTSIKWKKILKGTSWREELMLFMYSQRWQQMAFIPAKHWCFSTCVNTSVTTSFIIIIYTFIYTIK